MSKPVESDAGLPELELIEFEKRSEEKIKKLSKDVLGLQAEHDLVLLNHIPEIVEKLDHVTDDVNILREDYADTNRLVRKMFYEMVPSLKEKVEDLDSKVDLLGSKLDKINNKLDQLLQK